MDKKKSTASKKLILFLFINCVVVEVFSMVMIALNVAFSRAGGYTPDFSPLNSLIGAIVAEVIGFAIYAAKSAMENREGGVTYLNAKYDLENNSESEGNTHD